MCARSPFTKSWSVRKSAGTAAFRMPSRYGSQRNSSFVPPLNTTSASGSAAQTTGADSMPESSGPKTSVAGR